MKGGEPLGNSINDRFGDDLPGNHLIEHSISGESLHPYTVVDDVSGAGKPGPPINLNHGLHLEVDARAKPAIQADFSLAGAAALFQGRIIQKSKV